MSTASIDRVAAEAEMSALGRRLAELDRACSGLKSAAAKLRAQEFAELGRRIFASCPRFVPVEDSESVRRMRLQLIDAAQDTARRIRVGIERRIIGPAGDRPC